MQQVGYLEKGDINNLGNLPSHVTYRRPTVLFVHADWCPHCKVMKPTYEDLAKKHSSMFSFRAIKADGDESEKHLMKDVKKLDPDFTGFPWIGYFKSDGTYVGTKPERDAKGIVKNLNNILKTEG